MHLGTAAAALLAWSFARSHGAAFGLRFDDLDPLRTHPRFVASLREDLAWLGVVWDWEFAQAARWDVYAAALAALADAGRVYVCTCTRGDIQRRTAPPHHYDGHCRRHTTGANGLAAHLERGREAASSRRRPSPQPPAFRLDAGGALPDPMLWTRDGLPSYTLACALDDSEPAITHVVRGADLLPETPGQVAVMQALGRRPPAYIHFACVPGPDGAKLGKSKGAVPLREHGGSPERVHAAVAAAYFGAGEGVSLVDAWRQGPPREKPEFGVFGRYLAGFRAP